MSGLLGVKKHPRLCSLRICLIIISDCFQEVQKIYLFSRSIFSPYYQMVILLLLLHPPSPFILQPSVPSVLHNLQRQHLNCSLSKMVNSVDLCEEEKGGYSTWSFVFFPLRVFMSLEMDVAILPFSIQLTLSSPVFFLYFHKGNNNIRKKNIPTQDVFQPILIQKKIPRLFVFLWDVI